MDNQLSTSIDAQIPKIVEALQVVLNPKSTNQARQDAQSFLSSAEQSPDALALGFHFAANLTNPVDLRRFGIALMVDHLRFAYSGDGSENMLRDYVLKLTEILRDEDIPAVKNKVAQLWVEAAKRIWGPNWWQDMDQRLVNLWQSGQTRYIEFVLNVLEAMSDDIFNHNDSLAGSRPELASAFARICITQGLIEEFHRETDGLSYLRFGVEGWLLRLFTFLNTCLQQGSQAHRQSLKTLSVLQSLCPWMPPKALLTVNCHETLGSALVGGNIEIRIAAIETLCCIFSRINHESEDMNNLIAPMLESTSLQLLGEAFQWAGASMPEDDEQLYNFTKKLGELLACLGTWVDIRPSLLEDSCNIELFFQLLTEATKHPSIFISLPLYQIWKKFFKSKSADLVKAIQPHIGALLELSRSRLLRYDILPEDSTEPVIVFLTYDCDNSNQRESFIYKYRVLCGEIIQRITKSAPVEALSHILSEAVAFHQSLVSQDFDPTSYTRTSDISLQSDIHISAVEAAVRAHIDENKWLEKMATISNGFEKSLLSQERKKIANDMRVVLSEYCRTLMAIQVRYPDIQRKILHQVVSIICKISDNSDPVALSILDAILSIRSEQLPDSPAYNEMSKDLPEKCALTAQKLALVFADQFLPVYSDLEQKIQAVITAEADDSHDLQSPYYAFLVTVIHRAANLAVERKRDMLKQMMLPIKADWENPVFSRALESYDAFCSLTGWDQLPNFLTTQKFGQSSNWSESSLSEDGRQFQTDLLKRNEIIPVRLTKAIAKAMMDHIDLTSPDFQISCGLWHETMPFILPSLLKLLEYSTLFHNIDQWASLPNNVKASMSGLLQDRFWQNGISNESKDSFVSRVNNSKYSFEGFGSTVRRTVRQIRIGSCDILQSFSKLGEVFYAIPQLSSPLSNALYDHSQALTAHQFSALFTFSMQLINSCPEHLITNFVPHLIANLFKHARQKIEQDWDEANRQADQPVSNEKLDQEMKSMSILRSMTLSSCRAFYRLVCSSPNDEHSITAVVLSDTFTLEPLLMFATSAIRVHDTQSVNFLVAGLKGIVPRIKTLLSPDTVATASVSAYLCTNLLKAAITSFHEEYFVDSQRDLAALISLLIQLSPEHCLGVLNSLFELSAQPDRARLAVDKIVAKSSTNSHPRAGREIVLDLLRQIRGRSLNELGKINSPDGSGRKKRDRAVVAIELQQDRRRLERAGSEGLDGIANLLGGS